MSKGKLGKWVTLILLSGAAASAFLWLLGVAGKYFSPLKTIKTSVINS